MKNKNIHILPTDKPSKLYKEDSVYKLDNLVYGTGNQNIYITSDEEIKDGDWYFDGTNLVHKKTKYNDALVDGNKNAKKIILTTDQDLIKDDVQDIDDEFLDWFVKNPSCEKIEVKKMMECEKCGKEHCDNLQCRGYKDISYYNIIIPKEEPKQICDNCKIEISKYGCACGGKPKQETLEEAAERLYPTTIDSFTDSGIDLSERDRIIFTNGANWQQEQDKKLYSEEEVKQAYTEGGFAQLRYIDGLPYIDRDKWFEQFKKK